MNWPSLLLPAARRRRTSEPMSNIEGEKMMADDTMRQESRPLTDKEQDAIRTVKGMGETFYKYLSSLPPTRQRDMAMARIEEAVMWAVKGISG